MENALRMQINLLSANKRPHKKKSGEKAVLLATYILYYFTLTITFVPATIIIAVKFLFYDIWRGNLMQKQIRNFTWRFALMIESGLPLVQALDFLAVTAKGKFAKIIGQIKYEVEGGSTLCNAMAKTRFFPLFYVQIIGAGEIGGILDTILIRLNDYYKMKISSQKNVIHFSWLMGMMLSSGVPILDALKITADMFLRDKKFAKAIMHMRQKISEGQKNMTNAMMESQSNRYELFPAIFVQMVGIGENTGALDRMLTNFAKYSMENE
ncbi:MAG: type II secretion system F family protein [Parcubacteria group bacterium]